MRKTARSRLYLTSLRAATSLPTPELGLTSWPRPGGKVATESSGRKMTWVAAELANIVLTFRKTSQTSSLPNTEPRSIRPVLLLNILARCLLSESKFQPSCT